MEKEVLRLDGVWEFKEFPESARRMRDVDEGGWMPATVPSSIYTCLAEAGKIDLFELTANPEAFGWVSRQSWIFRKQFDAPSSLLGKERLSLIFEGLDTVSHIWLNDKLIGKTENMFIPYSLDITDGLKPSHNILHVKFVSALHYAERLMQRYGRLSERHFGDIRRSYIRKAQYQFGSVMGPALPGCGIFRSVRIEGACTATIRRLHIRTVDCNQHYADIRIALSLERVKQVNTPLQCRLHLTGGGLDITQNLEFSAQEEQHSILIHIDRPLLWWPKGYGVQHQYHLKAELYQNDRLLDMSQTDFGIRTLRLNRSADEHGTKFQFEVNEQPIYIKGANWMPLTVFPGTQTAYDYETMLGQAADAHINMLRVWAGGFYENPELYRLCDKLGILVWQDFMFASAYYPDRQWFTNMVEAEARIVIEQLRNHPCLALWCGNSRIDSLHEAGRLGAGRKFYGKMIYHELLPGLLSELDPDREYIPTTPFSGALSGNYSNPAFDTTDRWDIWNHAEGEEYDTAEKNIPRFVAEFGLQSLPPIETLSTLRLKEDGTPGSLPLEKHNYQPGGQERIAWYVAHYFTPSPHLKEFVWQSQVAQARAAKRYVEHLRCHNSINAGCLLWTLNDSVPSISFSAIDALQNPKALYYYAKRFFSPILIALLSQDENSVSQQITVINDGLHRITVTLECRLLDFFGKTLDETHIPVALSPMSRSNLYTLPKSFTRPLLQRATFLHLSLLADGSTLAENTYFFAPDKHLQWSASDIELEIIPTDNNGWRVILCAKTVIRDLQLIPPSPSRLSDNFITLLPGRPQEIDIQFETPSPAAGTPVQILSANQCQRGN